MALNSETSQNYRDFFSEALLWLFKWLSGFLVSFVLSSIGLNLFGYGTFSFVFVLLVFQGLFWRIFHKSHLITILIVDSVCVLLALLLRFYILVAPSM